MSLGSLLYVVKTLMLFAMNTANALSSLCIMHICKYSSTDANLSSSYFRVTPYSSLYTPYREIILFQKERFSFDTIEGTPSQLSIKLSWASGSYTSALILWSPV